MSTWMIFSIMQPGRRPTTQVKRPTSIYPGKKANYTGRKKDSYLDKQASGPRKDSNPTVQVHEDQSCSQAEGQLPR